MAAQRLYWAYGFIALLQGLLHNVFLLYHVEMFVSVYRIDKLSFWAGELLFLVWNSLNDPVFGWLSDRGFLVQRQTSGAVVQRRLGSLEWSGSLFAASFLLFWFDWHMPALQFVVCLCLYDGFLTMLELQHSALLADLAVSSLARTNLNWYSAVCSALGSLSVFVSYWLWGGPAFKLYCLLLAAIGLVGFNICVQIMKDNYVPQLDNTSTTPEERPCEPQVSHSQALRRFLAQVASHKNFVFFAVMNIIQVFHCHFNSNFFPMFLHNLLGEDIPLSAQSVILGASFVAPHLNNLYLLHLCTRWGVYHVIRLLFILKLVLGVAMLLVGVQQPWPLAIFIASNRIFTEGTCKLLNLVLSDLVDEDTVLHQRPSAVAALVLGTMALLSKPGQTLAPLVGTWLLNQYTGHDVFAQDGEGLSIVKDQWKDSNLRHGVFYILTGVPIVCASLQLVAWSSFTLRGRRLAWVKAIRDGTLKTTV